MNPNVQCFLTNVTYVPGKRQVTVEFSNTKDRVSKRYHFFPKMHFSAEKIPRESFFAVLPRQYAQRIRVNFNGKNATVFAATFSDLKGINNLLRKCFGACYNLIEPERQFLIEKGWSYFDCFAIDGEPRRLDVQVFPDVNLNFLSDTLRNTVSELLVNNKALARELVHRIVSSRLLKIPLVGREESKNLEETFLENIFFGSGSPIHVNGKRCAAPVKAFFGKSKIDFSGLATLLSSRPFSNLGLDSLNCSCCSPASLDSENVLASSEAKVKFLRDAFYFDSASKTWAAHFHESSENKGERLRRKSEYFSTGYPSGPFYRGSTAFVLLADALELSSRNLVEILPDKKPKWFCTRKESALSQNVNCLRKTLEALGHSIKKETEMVVASKGLFYSHSLDLNPDFFYRKTTEKLVSRLFSSIPGGLTEPGSRFFDPALAISFETLLSGIFRDFEGIIDASPGSRVAFADFRAVLDSRELLSVSRKFAELYKVDPAFLSLKAP